jgi:hypothetical protein
MVACDNQAERDNAREEWFVTPHKRIEERAEKEMRLKDLGERQQ